MENIENERVKHVLKAFNIMIISFEVVDYLRQKQGKSPLFDDLIQKGSDIIDKLESGIIEMEATKEFVLMLEKKAFEHQSPPIPNFPLGGLASL